MNLAKTVTIFKRNKNIINNIHGNAFKQKKTLAFIIPAFNEEITITETIKALLKLTSADNIYISDDGSSDNTVIVAKRYIDNVLSYPSNKGKANALNSAIREFSLVDKYEYIMPIDADTFVTKSFKNESLAILQADTQKTIACVVGRVTAIDHCWMTKFRIWEYEIAQLIHKAAQDKENAVSVCTGCATVYRSSVFAEYNIPTDTMTEDMDLTFLIHRERIGRIVYANNALVITQDPHTIKDYARQVYRWYSGFWQCVEKHNIPWGGQALDFEVGMIALEGLFNSLLVVGYLFISIFIFVPTVLYGESLIILFPFLIDLVFFLIPTFLLVGKRYGAWDIFLYIPHFYAARMIGALVFLMSFMRVVMGIDLQHKWNKVKRLQLMYDNKLWHLNPYFR